MSRWPGQCHDGCCQLSPGPGLRGECDTELIWPPEADAEAELRPGCPDQARDSRVWFGRGQSPSLGQARPSLWRQCGAQGAASHHTDNRPSCRGWYPHVVSSNHPNPNNAYGCKHINCPHTNIHQFTRDF